MTYVALLRGINVGGKNKVEMKKLKADCEKLGLQHVRTYINSGNIIFTDTSHSRAQLTTLMETAIKTTAGLDIKVVLRDLPQIKKVVAALPAKWVNDDQMKCDVMFLWPEIDSASILKTLPAAKPFEDIVYLPGTVLWRVDRSKITSSGLLKIVGTKVYRSMTIRNCTTVRKLADLMAAPQEA